MHLFLLYGLAEIVYFPALHDAKFQDNKRYIFVLLVPRPICAGRVTKARFVREQTAVYIIGTNGDRYETDVRQHGDGVKVVLP